MSYEIEHLAQEISKQSVKGATQLHATAWRIVREEKGDFKGVLLAAEKQRLNLWGAPRLCTV